MFDPFLSAKLRVGRAKEHIATLQRMGHEFWNRCPYTFVAELNPDGLNKTYKFRLTEPVPAVFDFLVIEAVEHLRASLDHATYATAVLGGKRDPKAAYFPIADTAASLETDVMRRGRCKDLPPQIVAFLRSLEPYHRGKGAAAWTLNKICNSSKHRLITEVGMDTGGSSINLLHLPPGGWLVPQVWDREKNEIAYFACPKEAEPKYSFDVGFFIVFGPVEPVEGQPAIPALAAISEKITEIVLSIEAESCRLGLIP